MSSDGKLTKSQLAMDCADDKDTHPRQGGETPEQAKKKKGPPIIMVQTDLFAIAQKDPETLILLIRTGSPLTMGPSLTNLR